MSSHRVPAGETPQAQSAAQKFLLDAATKSADLAHRDLIRRNMDSYDAAHMRGRARIKDWEAARRRCQEIKREAVNNLDRYLLQFEEKVTSRGGHVFWAANGDEACAYIRDLAVSHGVKTVVKSKSMVTEEIQLAPVLEEQGIKVWETDLGEFIVQLRHEAPYHIVTPAMHLDRQQIRELFRDRLGEDIADADPQKLRWRWRGGSLREAFFAADMGISGANFIVADSGAIAISTNEGNGRLSAGLPKIHVVVTGIEKVIPRLTDLATLSAGACRLRYGPADYHVQHLDRRPRRTGEADGPEEFMLSCWIMGAAACWRTPEEREVLHCIRCGACLNICPVYRNIGGHTYNTTYPGPIGSVLTPHLRGSEFQHLSYRRHCAARAAAFVR